jgi:hypothetical protein
MSTRVEAARRLDTDDTSLGTNFERLCHPHRVHESWSHPASMEDARPAPSGMRSGKFPDMEF